MAVVFPPQNETFFRQAVCAYVASLLSMPDFMTQVKGLATILLYFTLLELKCQRGDCQRFSMSDFMTHVGGWVTASA